MIIRPAPTCPQPLGISGEGVAFETSNSHVGMEAIVTEADAAKLQAQAMGFQKSVGVSNGIKYAEFTIPESQIAERTVQQVALRGLA